MGRGRLRSVDKGSDDSDEDYVVDKDEYIESEDEYVSSFAEDETEDSLCEFDEEEEFMEKKVKNVCGSNLAIQTRKRKRKTNSVVVLGKKMFSSRSKNDDDCVDSDDSDEYDEGKRDRNNKRGLYRRQESCIGSDSHEYCRRQRNEALKSNKKNKVSYVEEDSESYDNADDSDDEEFMPDEVDDDIDDAGDNDDEEFMPDEVDDNIDDEDDDFVDNEDEVTDLKRNKQLGWLKKQGERISKGQKRMRYCSDLKNNGSQRPGNKRRLIKKTGDEHDLEFANNEISVEHEKAKTTEERPQRRRNIVISDSEYEVTISEEEKEQIREANKICRNVTDTLRSATPVKMLQRDQDSVQIRTKNSGKKGKEKMDGLKIETGKQVCGICLSEEGKKTVRGALNCCSHYFCFACIMEWSKVESRCPVCKQRFSTICKSSSSMSDSEFAMRTPVIQVPQRDQVYQPSEEELRGYLDPYDNVFCTECEEGGDDAFMLLCDICDSPAHTYCVGLGYDVPEGNWYCDGCRLTALDSLNPHGLNPIPNGVGTSLSFGSSPMENVRETFDLNEAYVPDTPLGNGNGQPSMQISVGDFPVSPASGSGAFTLLERRRIQLQIQQILNTRRQQDHETNGTIASVSGGRLLGSQIVRGGVLEPQLMEVTQRSTAASHVFPFHERSEAANNTSSWLNRDPFVTRLTPSHDTAIQRQTSTYNNTSSWLNGDHFVTRLTPSHDTAIQRQTSTSNEGFYGSFLRNEFAGINATFGSIFGQQQVQLESDVSTSSQPCREGTLPSRRFQGNQHLPL